MKPTKKQANPKVVWIRSDGLVRVVHSYYGRPQLVVEGKHTNAMGEDSWIYVDNQLGGQALNLEAFALALYGTPFPKDHGFHGDLQ